MTALANTSDITLTVEQGETTDVVRVHARIGLTPLNDPGMTCQLVILPQAINGDSAHVSLQRTVTDRIEASGVTYFRVYLEPQETSGIEPGNYDVHVEVASTNTSPKFVKRAHFCLTINAALAFVTASETTET